MFCPLLLLSAEKFPCRFIILLAIAAVEGGDVLDGALDGAAGLGVVGDGAVELLVGGGALDTAFPFLAVEAYAGEATVVGEDDAAVGVIPGVGLVLLENGELDAVDGFQLI